MANINNFLKDQVVPAVNPYTSKTANVGPLFDFARNHYDCVKDRENIIPNLAEEVLEIQAIINAAAGAADCEIVGLPYVNQFLSELAITLINMRDIE